jgi:hypothetical protein
MSCVWLPNSTIRPPALTRIRVSRAHGGEAVADEDGNGAGGGGVVVRGAGEMLKQRVFGGRIEAGRRLVEHQ